MSQDPMELERLKKDLEGYREMMLPINKVIEWEQNYYPVILIAAITLIFSYAFKIVFLTEYQFLMKICYFFVQQLQICTCMHQFAFKRQNAVACEL